MLNTSYFLCLPILESSFKFYNRITHSTLSRCHHLSDFQSHIHFLLLSRMYSDVHGCPLYWHNDLHRTHRMHWCTAGKAPSSTEMHSLDRCKNYRSLCLYCDMRTSFEPRHYATLGRQHHSQGELM